MSTETNIKLTRTIYRGTSPSTVRLESRVRELEDLLDLERDGRVRAERNANELAIQLEALSERLDELSGSSSQVNETVRRKDMELMKNLKIDKLSCFYPSNMALKIDCDIANTWSRISTKEVKSDYVVEEDGDANDNQRKELIMGYEFGPKDVSNIKTFGQEDRLTAFPEVRSLLGDIVVLVDYTPDALLSLTENAFNVAADMVLKMSLKTPPTPSLLHEVPTYQDSKSTTTLRMLED
nr:unnamed protein product [Spirometra erinaceieuropaei]